MNRYMSACLLCLFVACGEAEKTTLSLNVYPAEGTMHDSILVDNSASFMEVVLSGGERPFVEQFPMTGSGGTFSDLPVGAGYKLTARGYQTSPDGTTSLVFYGGTTEFDVVDGQPIAMSIQVGRSDCVGYNRPSIYRSADGKADLIDKRVGFGVSKLADGRVLITGGADLDASGAILTVHDSVEIYDPTQGQFMSLLDGSGQPVRLSEPRAFHSATRLQNGTVLIAGGQSTPAGGLAAGVTIFNPAGPIFEAPINAAGFLPRKRHQAQRLNDGSVLVAGGEDVNEQALTSSFRYFPTDQSFRAQGDLAQARRGHSLNAIERGAELAIAAGGINDSGLLRSIEVFTTNPAQTGCVGNAVPEPNFGCWISLGTTLELPAPVWGHASVSINDGSEVVILGGFTSRDRTQASNQVTVISSALNGAREAGVLALGGGELAVAEGSDGSTPFILVAGGRIGDAPQQRYVRLVRSDLNGVVQYTQEDLTQGCIQQGFPEARWAAQAIRLDNDTIVVLGGTNRSVRGFSSTRRAEVYFPEHVPSSF
ncbi:MAG: hypothetical protein CMH52_01785 [Myxococcales bacterium]|nr:hypothetical protein [Myxococcales bacterium]